MASSSRAISIGLRWPTVSQATWIMVGLGLTWRIVRYLLAFPLWGDEAYVAVNLREREFADLSRPLEFFQIAPPGFLWVEWLVAHHLGFSERALRLVPYLSGVAALLLFWRFCRAVTTRRTVLVAVAVLATSLYPVRHAAEIKPYATDLLVSLVLTVLAWTVYGRVHSYRRWSLLIAAATAGVWCSYPAVFPAGSVAILLGARVLRERSALPRALWLIYCGLFAVSWGLMYFTFADSQARAASFLPSIVTWRNAFPPLAEPWRLPWWLIEIHTGQMLAYPGGGHNFGSIITTILVATGCVRMARRRARRPLLALLLGALPLALVAAALRRYPYGTSTRVMLYMAPAFCLLAGEGLIAWLRFGHRLNRGPIAVAALLALFPVIGAASDAMMPYAGYDNVVHRSLARDVASRAAPDDEFVVFNSVTPPPMIADLMITRWLQRVAVVRFYLSTYASVPIRWEPDPRTVRPNRGGRLWLVVQRHGDDRFFSEERLAEYMRDLEGRLGPPGLDARFSLPNDESWSIYVYPSMSRAATEIGADRR